MTSTFTMGNGKKSLVVLVIVAITLGVNGARKIHDMDGGRKVHDMDGARKVEDCELINLREMHEQLYSTFNKSIRFSILPEVDEWQTYAIISDSVGNNGTLMVGRTKTAITYGLWDRSKKLNETNRSYNTLLKNQWTDILVEAQRSDVSDLESTINMKIIIEELLVSKTYDPLLRNITFQPPLTIQWRNDGPLDVVFNCKNKDCLEYSRILVANPYDPKKSFFVQPGESFEGLIITLEPRFPPMESLEFPGNEAGWKNITLTKDMNSLKILIDGNDFGHFSSADSFSQFEIKSVQLKGEGLLTWCDPRPPSTCMKSTKEAIPLPWVLVAVLGIIVFILSILLVVCIYRKHPKAEEHIELMTSSPATMAGKAPVAPPTGDVPSLYNEQNVYETSLCNEQNVYETSFYDEQNVYETSLYDEQNVYNTIPELREGNKDFSHDTENDIYVAFVAPPTGDVPSRYAEQNVYETSLYNEQNVCETSLYAEQNVCETIPELREGNRDFSRDTENSIYEAFEP